MISVIVQKRVLASLISITWSNLIDTNKANTQLHTIPLNGGIADENNNN